MVWKKVTMYSIVCVCMLSSMMWGPGCSLETPKSKDSRPQYSTMDQYIVNGVKDLAHPAVGSLTANKSSFCTGTLIAPRVVVTAAHCIDAFDRLKGQTLAFRIDIPVNQNEYRTIYPGIDIANTAKHPKYSNSQTGITDDIAIVILTTPVFSVPTVPWNKTAATQAWINQKALFMGYGRLSAADTQPAPRKYSTYLTITHLDRDAQRGGAKPNTIGYSGNNTSVCQGDSGGPALLQIQGTWNVVAVTSHGTAYNCTGTSYSFRTDPYADWIQGFIDKYSTCEGANPTCGNCASCDGKACKPKTFSAIPNACKVCEKDADCGGGYCIQVGTGLRCVQQCDQGNCCPNGNFCTVVANDRSYCLPETMVCPPLSCQTDKDCSSIEECVSNVCRQKLPKLRTTTCQPCTQNSDCGSGGYCETPDGRGGRCLQPCEGTGELCPLGFACKEVLTGLKQCVRRDNTCTAPCNKDEHCLGGLKCKDGTCIREGGGTAGEPCSNAMPCKDGLQCTPSSSGARCYQTCGFQAGSAGAPCRPNNQCDAGLQCFANPLGGGNFCVRPCQSSTDCTSGGNCFPGINICACQSADQCQNGAKCNMIIQGFAGVCSSGKQTPCPDGEECASSPGQPSICVKAGSGNREPGQACDNLNRCKDGNTCTPGLNRCLESCSDSQTCKGGGTCRSLLGPDQFCLCSNDSECKTGQKCQVVAQNIGYCADPPDTGCKEGTCPDNFVCKDKKCVAKDTPGPEPGPEPTAPTDGGSTTTDAPSSSEGSSTTNDGGTTTTPEVEAPGQACGCESTPTQPMPLSMLFWLGFFGLLAFRRRSLTE